MKIQGAKGPLDPITVDLARKHKAMRVDAIKEWEKDAQLLRNTALGWWKTQALNGKLTTLSNESNRGAKCQTKSDLNTAPDARSAALTLLSNNLALNLATMTALAAQHAVSNVIAKHSEISILVQS